ncbi:hypothetical protein EVAR_39614_1 [Eumeta japonica]|uniref:C2H2-type domain-containing protein n=1 Tax=Eumeta variegata TaxID=151549 RepID=A0A4C1WFA3_EUMVA|nr:hypothetical protein EVAR_39614_1 [Eumeta japonica]
MNARETSASWTLGGPQTTAAKAHCRLETAIDCSHQWYDNDLTEGLNVLFEARRAWYIKMASKRKATTITLNPVTNDTSVVKRKSYLEEVIDIENKEIRDLNIERELMKEAERKRKHLQKSTNEIKTKIIGSFNEEDYQVYHYENKQPNELDSVKIENTDGTQVKGSFICSGVKNLEETETFIGKSLKKVLERLDFNANKNLSISHNSVEGCTQKILDTVLKEENMNNEIGNRQILCKTIINEKLRCPITDLKIAMKTEPIIELIDDDLAKGKNDLTIDMNIKIEEENVMDKPREIMDNLKEIRGGSVIGDNSNISHCAHQHPSHNHLRNIEGIENTQKGGNGTFLEEIPLGEVRIADDLDDKVNATFIYRSPKRNTNTTPKEKIIDFKEKNTESMQNYIDNDKLTINSSSLIDVKNEIKREPLEECFERDMVTISNDSVQQLSIASMMDAMDTKSEVNDGSVAEESNIDIEVLTILPEVCKMEEETFECGTFGYETYEIHEKCIMENELSLDKEQDILFDAKNISLKTEIKCIDPDIMKQKYDCRVCVRTFNTLAAYYDHYICHDLSKYQCPYCKVIVDMEKFYHHCFTHVILNYHESIGIDQSSNVKCKQCDEKIQKEYLLAHYEWHILVKGKPIVMVFPKSLLNTIIEI